MSALRHLLGTRFLQRCAACFTPFTGRSLRFVEDGAGGYLAHCPGCRCVLLKTEDRPPEGRIDKAPDLFPETTETN